MRWIILALAVLATTSCSSPLFPRDTYRLSGVWPIEPIPEHYADLFEAQKECLDLPDYWRNRFGQIRWWQTDKITWVEEPKQVVLGLTQDRDIYIVRREVRGVRVPGHEILHFLVPNLRHADAAFMACDPFVTDPRRLTD